MGVAVDPTDSTHFFIANNGGGNVQMYNRPVSQAATLAATITGFVSPTHSGNPTAVAFDSVGNMFVADIDRIWSLAHPVGGASVPTAIITTNLALATCVAVDAAGHLYVGDAGATGANGKLLSYAAPYSGAPVTTQIGILATDAIVTCAVQPGTNRIFLANVSPGGSIVGYNTPLAANASPAITIANPAGTTPGGIAFDSTGALYVGFSQTGSTGIAAYAAPLGSSSPTFTFPNGGFFATGLAFGP
ncbi:MAG: hypothetical protein M3Z37_09115 [Candidatus Eremiobacteraeota bacterium]|nr:hypothetical protein [Candidatus Eremiobacteraeota bacterium]